MSNLLEELQKEYRKIFQTDQADLDFGIYRIMNQRRAEVEDYLENQLMQDIESCFAKHKTKSLEDLRKELVEKEKQSIDLGFNPDKSEPIQKLRQELANFEDVDDQKTSVLSELLQFFRRYYKEGDFLSLPRYKENVYAMPYNGEEVKLYWANCDQYYVKTAERFRDYRFKLESGKIVNFKLTAANTEAGNNKSQEKERRFVFVGIEEITDSTSPELIIKFEFKPDDAKRPQKDIDAETVNQIFAETTEFIEWRKELAQPKPTESNPKRTIFEKHLRDYTAKNTFDYFVHKDLEPFLTRELDFYIKNEVFFLDDVENETVSRVELALSKVKALRMTGKKLIKFLAQIENFQKLMFLKKKFVVQADYCLSLDKIDKSFYAEILASESQIAEWIELFKIDEIEENLFSEQLKVKSEKFLEANPHLLIDTKFFSADFKLRLLATIKNLDEQTDGVLIKSDNFQALNLLQEKYHEQVKCIYIDPPYNTGNDGFMYKDGYQHSSWLSMMENRLEIARELMSQDAAIFTSIDDEEVNNLKNIQSIIWSDENFVSNIIWQKKYSPQNDAKWFSDNHDFITCYAKNKTTWRPNLLARTVEQIARYTNRDNDSRGEWKSADLSVKTYTANYDYPITTPKGRIVKPPKGRCWMTSKERIEKLIADNRIWFGENGDNTPSLKVFLTEAKQGFTPLTIWFHQEVGHNQEATQEVKNLELEFSSPKPFRLVKRVLEISSNDNSTILDFFAGSGTTGHAVINLNREDGGRRKFILVEANDYFETVLKPRILKVLYAAEWKDGKPKPTRQGTSAIIKYLTLESYEDAMNNLDLHDKDANQMSLLAELPEFREDYILNYMLEFETRNSQSRLNLANFASPFEYTMNIAQNGINETAKIKIDLVETFNYLIGLSVGKVQQIKDFRIIRGRTRTGEETLIIWRITKGLSQTEADEKLNKFFAKQNFDLQNVKTIYTNGDCTLGMLRAENETWQLKMIEGEFLDKMFESD